jgi:uncharacterized membrane protein
MAVVLVVAMALPFLLPPRYSLFPQWLMPALLGALLVTLIIADPGRIDRRSELIRACSIALVVVLCLGAAFFTGRLVVELVHGSSVTNSAALLLRVGGVAWVYLIIAFAFVYWEFDGGGPEARAVADPEFPDMAFPEQLNPSVAPPGWRPQFFDYLYVGFTNATAFSPTDVMPLARWAKLTMAMQASASLIILGLVIARAVNILK